MNVHVCTSHHRDTQTPKCRILGQEQCKRLESESDHQEQIHTVFVLSSAEDRGELAHQNFGKNLFVVPTQCVKSLEGRKSSSTSDAWVTPVSPSVCASATMIKWGMKVGGQVDIKRSDGRVHPAVVSGFNDSTRSVTVEWFENQETKGKELDLHHLAALNPAVFDALKGGNKTEDKQTPSIDEVNGSVGADAPKGAQRRPTRAVKPSGGRKKNLPAVAHPSAAPIVTSDSSKDDDVDRKKSGGSNISSSGGGGKGKVFNNIQEIAAKREARRANHEKQAKKNEVDKAAKANNPNWEFAVMVDDYRSTKHIVQGIPPDMQASDRKITVCVRKRPLNRGERNRCDVDVTTIPDGENLLLHECKNKVDLTRYLEHHHFRFDQAFDESVDNATVYKYSAAPLVRTIFEKGSGYDPPQSHSEFLLCLDYSYCKSSKKTPVFFEGNCTEGWNCVILLQILQMFT